MMISRKKFTIRYFLFFGLVPALILFYSVLSASKVDVIKVQYRKAAELVTVVQSMLSAGGSVTVSQRLNSLVTVDSPEAIRRVYADLERFDKPVEQVRIHVRFNTPSADEERAVKTVLFEFSGPRWN
jgi:type II secretory pathway component HofQ